MWGRRVVCAVWKSQVATRGRAAHTPEIAHTHTCTAGAGTSDEPRGSSAERRPARGRRARPRGQRLRDPRRVPRVWSSVARGFQKGQNKLCGPGGARPWPKHVSTVAPPPGMALNVKAIRLGPPKHQKRSYLRVRPLSLSRVMLTVSAAVVSQEAQDVAFERGGSAAPPAEQ